MEIFAGLNENRQKALIAEAIRLQIEQGQEEIVMKEKGTVTQDELKERTQKRIKDTGKMIERISTFSNEQKAAMMIFMNELTKGQMIKEETISVTIDSKNLNIYEFIEKHLPETNIKNALGISAEIKKKLNADDGK